MKSRTSFSKLTVFKKDLTRFAPVWALYLIGMLMILFENGSYYDYDRFARNYLVEFIAATGVINLIYAGLCAMMLFGDLYNTRMCYSLHAMPQRREHWLLSHLAAGCAFSFVPNLLISAAMMLFLQDYWFLALYWLLAASMQFIFYFGIATVAALLTGNRFAMLAVYAGLNFVSLLAYATVVTIYQPMLTGVKVVSTPFMQLCPAVYQYYDCEFFLFKGVEMIRPEYGTYYFYQYTGLGPGWGYMAIMTAVGLAAMGVSVILYRLRHLECAGDFVAFRKLNPAACVIITLCVGMLFASAGEWMFGSSYILWLIVGVIIGYFGSLMLIERRVKVFRGKTFLGLAVLGVLLTGSILLFKFDVFGIVHWTPEVSDVKSVTVANYNSDSNGFYYDDWYYGNRISVELTEEEEIAEIIEAHEDILKWVDEEYTGGHYVVLDYKLKDGRTVRRAYTAPAFGPNYEIISKYFYTPEQILGYSGMDWEEYVSGVDYMYYDYGQIPEDIYEKIMEALKTDCEAGFITTVNEKEGQYYLEFQTNVSNGNVDNSFYRSLYIQSGAVNTIAVLESPEVVMCYGDWEKFLSGMYELAVNGGELDREQYEGLLEAVRADCELGYVHTDYTVDSICTIYYSGQINGYYYDRYLQVNQGAENTAAWLEENGY